MHYEAPGEAWLVSLRCGLKSSDSRSPTSSGKRRSSRGYGPVGSVRAGAGAAPPVSARASRIIMNDRVRLEAKSRLSIQNQ